MDKSGAWEMKSCSAPCLSEGMAQERWAGIERVNQRCGVKEGKMGGGKESDRRGGGMTEEGGHSGVFVVGLLRDREGKCTAVCVMLSRRI